ncbi:hypothetical protein [Gloeobacter violaceus]|nr:hypothetical protein [Gloeobacter violaceus]
MLSLFLKLALVLFTLVVLGTALKIVVLPLAFVAGLLGFLAQYALPIALVGGVIWLIRRDRSQKRLPGS